MGAGGKGGGKGGGTWRPKDHSKASIYRPTSPFEKCRFLQPKASHFLDFMGGAAGLNERAIYQSAFPFRVTFLVSWSIDEERALKEKEARYRSKR